MNRWMWCCLAGLSLVGCTGSAPPATVVPGGTTDGNGVPAASTATVAMNVAGQPPILPDPVLTPGDILAAGPDDVCVIGYSASVRDVPLELKRQVYAEYGIRHHRRGDYEVDHLISLELGGSNSIKNLWPESYLTQPWNASVKDQLENELHDEVCAGQIDLPTAQRLIAGNWITAYQSVFHTTQPLPDVFQTYHKRHHRHRKSSSYGY